MAAKELARKIRELEEGQAELKREISKLVPERRAQSPSSSSRRPPPAQRAPAVVIADVARGPRRAVRQATHQGPARAGAGRACRCPRGEAPVLVGGRNNVLVDPVSRRIPLVTDRPTIIFGVDVTHPHPVEDSSPSIAALWHPNIDQKL